MPMGARPNQPIVVQQVGVMHNSFVTLKLIELKRPIGVRLWSPFEYEEAGLGFTRNWWYHGPVYPDSTSSFLRAFENATEVARVELDDEVHIDHYADVPDLRGTALEIQFIEVQTDHRLEGIGSAVVRLLQGLYPDRRLVAFSEGADGFWSSLGWSCHLHADPEEAPRYRPLFIATAAPEGSSWQQGASSHLSAIDGHPDRGASDLPQASNANDRQD